MKWKIAAASVLAVVVVGLGAIYYVAGTPTYSLYLLRKAVREGNREAFYHHFDARKVIENAVGRVVGGVPAGPKIVSRKAADFLVPAAERILQGRIDERLNDPEPAPVLHMTIESVQYSGQAAYVTLRDTTDNSTTKLVLERMADRHWKVIDVDLAKMAVQFSYSDVQQEAEKTMPPEMPGTVRPNLPAGIGDMPKLP